jgi:hypothetical protein
VHFNILISAHVTRVCTTIAWLIEESWQCAIAVTVMSLEASLCEIYFFKKKFTKKKKRK